MCNVFEIVKRKGKLPTILRPEGRVALNALDAAQLIRRTDKAPVVLDNGEVVSMRWGFMRAGLGPMNNARSERLDRPMWSKAFVHRRCLIPVAHFYEWSGEKGRKRTHKFSHPDGEWLWMAGMWEESREFGQSFTMLTTAANRMMSSIHHRMPTVLNEEGIVTYLSRGMKTFAPANDSLVVSDAPNPLVKKKLDEQQGELF